MLDESLELAESTIGVPSENNEEVSAETPTENNLAENTPEIKNETNSESNPTSEIIHENEISETKEKMMAVENLIEEQAIENEAPVVIEESKTTDEIENTSNLEIATTSGENIHQEIHAIQETIEEEPVEVHHEADYSGFEKKDFVELGEKLLASVKREGASTSDFRNIDSVLKAIKPAFDELKINEKKEARHKFVEENGNDEGFQYKNDNYTVRFESLLVQLREERTKFYQKIEREREGNFERKTNLLQQLREVVEGEESGQSKDTWKKFKQIQEDWKAAGNINSPHNATLWSAYSALIDRYFSIRNIQNELKDLDRKKNLVQKTDVVEKIEGIANSLETTNLTSTALKQANELLEEYKHIGPAQRDAQEALWTRLKAAFDVIYNKRREQSQASQALQDEVYAAKVMLQENLQPYLTFDSTSINDWNAKTKEVMALQDQWNAIKGAMPKDKGKELSSKFWADLKIFFQHKNDFFKKLEATREENLRLKTSLCEEVEVFLTANDTSAEASDKVIELQKTWRTIGHVPEKFKDKIFDRFKKSCDAFFDMKRTKNNEVEKEYDENLKKKVALCEKIESESKSNPDLSKLAEYKAEFNAIGYVPRKEMQSIQRRFIDAINAFVKASSGASGAEKEKIVLQNEVEGVLKGQKGGSKALDRKEQDIRHKIKGLEDDIALWKNNMEFFARSKNADAVRADFNQKISAAEKELLNLKQQLKVIVAAN